MSQKLRESLIIRLVYLFSACSHYVKQHFRWGKDSALVLLSAEQCPWYCHGMRPSCSVKLPLRLTCVKLSSPNSLMRLSQESISCKDLNMLPRSCCAALTFPHLCAPASLFISFKLRQTISGRNACQLLADSSKKAPQSEASTVCSYHNLKVFPWHLKKRNDLISLEGKTTLQLNDNIGLWHNELLNFDF